jgi:hypothetical protein
MKLSHVPGFGLIAAFYCRTTASAAFCPYNKSLRVRERKPNGSLPFGRNRVVPGTLAVLLFAAKEGEQSDSAEDGWESNDTSVSRPTPALKGGKENPDMFIPVFTIVAITGFVGLYGYETLRLDFEGELYVPF